MTSEFFIDLFRTISTGLFGVWAGRCWQRAIDAEKTLDALALKYESVDNVVDDEFKEVEQLLMDYAEKLESPTSADLNRVLNEDTVADRRVTEPNPLHGSPERLRESSLSEGGEAADSNRDHGKEARHMREQTDRPSTGEKE